MLTIFTSGMELLVASKVCSYLLQESCRIAVHSMISLYRLWSRYQPKCRRIKYVTFSFIYWFNLVIASHRLIFVTFIYKQGLTLLRFVLWFFQSKNQRRCKTRKSVSLCTYDYTQTKRKTSNSWRRRFDLREKKHQEKCIGYAFKHKADAQKKITDHVNETSGLCIFAPIFIYETQQQATISH